MSKTPRELLDAVRQYWPTQVGKQGLWEMYEAVDDLMAADIVDRREYQVSSMINYVFYLTLSEMLDARDEVRLPDVPFKALLPGLMRCATEPDWQPEIGALIQFVEGASS